MRFIAYPVIRQNGGSLRQLHHGVRVIALANADRDRLARVPLLLLRALKSTLLPSFRGQNAARLTININTRFAAKAQLPHEVSNAVNTPVVGQRVVIGITRVNDGAIHVHHAMTTLLVIAEGMVTKIKIAWVANRLLRRALAGSECTQGHERLKGGARWVRPVNRPIEQWFVDIGIQRIPIITANTIHEQIRIISWHRHQRQNFTIGRINGDQCATPFTKGSLSHLL